MHAQRRIRWVALSATDGCGTACTSITSKTSLGASYPVYGSPLAVPGTQLTRQTQRTDPLAGERPRELAVRVGPARNPVEGQGTGCLRGTVVDCSPAGGRSSVALPTAISRTNI